MSESAEVDSYLRPENPGGALAKQYLDLLLRAKRREASELVLGAVEAGTSIKDVYLQVFQPVQYEVGRLWQRNEISVAQEHFCTAATQMVMSQLYPKLFTGSRSGHHLVTACVSGDLHEVGARILTDFFEMEGWDTYYVGANTPEQSLVGTIFDQEADLVALSATMIVNVPAVASAIEAIRAELPEVPIMVGGFPFLQNADLVREVGGDATAVDAAEAIRIGRELVEARASG